MGIKEYIEEKAKRTALLGLTAATILGGAMGLTSCDNNENPVDTSYAQTGDMSIQNKKDNEIVKEFSSAKKATNNIEKILQTQDKDFELNTVIITSSAFDGTITLDYFSELVKNNNGTNDILECGTEISKESFDKIYALCRNNDDDYIHVNEYDVPDETTNDILKHIVILIIKPAMKSNSNTDLMNIIYNETKNCSNLNVTRHEYQAEMAD